MIELMSCKIVKHLNFSGSTQLSLFVPTDDIKTAIVDIPNSILFQNSENEISIFPK